MAESRGAGGRDEHGGNRVCGCSINTRIQHCFGDDLLEVVRYAAIHKALTERLAALEAQKDIAHSTDFEAKA
jgi:hypothetical protein